MVIKYKQVDEKTLDLLPVAVVLFDNKRIYFLNKKAIEIFKLSRQRLKELDKISVFDFLDKKYHQQFRRNNSLILKGEVVPAAELEFRNFKNEVRFIEAKSNAVAFHNKTVVQSVFTEVSERQKKISEYEQSKELLQNISNNSLDVIFHIAFTPESKLKFISDSSKHILGFSPAEIYENPAQIRGRIHPEDQDLLLINRSDYSKNNKDRKMLVRFKHKNGKQIYLEISINAVYNETSVITGLIGEMRDVTHRTETEALLIETKEKFDLITNNANDIVAFFTYFPAERYLYVSPNIKKILGYDAAKLLNDHSFFTKKLSGQNEEFIEAETLLKNYQKKNIVKSHHFAFKILNQQKEEVWLENNLVPITGAKGKISFFLNIMRNITEQKDKELELKDQYNSYRNLLDNSPVAYVIHDHGNILYINKALATLFKIKNKSQILGKFGIDFFTAPERKKAVSRVKDLYEKNRGNKASSYVLRDTEGNLLEVEIKSVLIKFNNTDCILSLVNNLTDKRQREEEKLKTLLTETSNKQLQKEIKERQEMEKSLIEKTAHLSSIFENSTHLIWTVNRKLQVTSYNQNFHDVVALQHGIDIKPGYKIDEHLEKGRNEYINFWYNRYAEAFAGKKQEFEKEDYNDKKVFRKIFINPIYNKSGEVTDISCIAHDITDSKIYEQKLLNQTGKLSAIFDSSHHYIWTINRESKLTSFNKNYFDLITIIYGTKPYLGFTLNRGVLTNDKEYTELLEYHYNKAFSGNATSFEIETLDKNYKKIYLEIFLNPIFENDNVVEVSGIAHNITEKKQVQQRMELSLKEKEILLREVHHRVKNNMQVISSILNLQSSYVSDEYALTLLKESQNRIKTMAYIHESLYQNKSFTSVNFSDYVHTLVYNIVQSYSYSDEKIKLELNVEKVMLTLDSSIPAGLIINELVTNAIKHAFPGDRQGTISLDLKCENNFVFLELKDNGVGFAEGISFENSNSLGLQLVNTLIEQLGGEFKFNSQKDIGTQVLITFKM